VPVIKTAGRFRFAAHYGLNSDIEVGPKSANSGLDGRQRRDAPCGSVADQRGKHEIKTSVI
jgi:hypothetical protein